MEQTLSSTEVVKVCFINVRTTCDAHLKTHDIVTKWAGSSHDSYILLNSKIYDRFCNRDFGDILIIADSGYPIKNVIVIPLLHVANVE